MPERAVADPIKILVVGGDPESRHGATRTLDATPGLWVVGVVATAVDAVAAVGLVHPDVVLIDVSTTAADTLDAVRRIKAGGHVPGVLLLTTDAAADLRERAAAVGVDGWLARDELGEAALPAIRAAAGTPAAPSPAGVAQPRSDVTGGMAGGFDETVVFDRITRSAAELIGARVASLWIADDSSHAISVRAWSDSDLGRDWSPATLSEASGGLGAVATHREVQDRADIVADDSFLPAESRQWAVRHGLSSALVVPVVLGGDLLAVLALFSAHPFEFGVDEHELLDRFTALAAVTLATSRAHQEALRDRDFHRSVAEHATEAIIAIDAGGRVSYINPRAETMFDCHAERVVGRDIKALAAHGDVDPTIVEAIARHLRNAQEVSQQDLTFSRHSGETLEATMSVRRLPGIRDEPAGFVFVVRDITDIRSTLRSLQQTERLSVMGLLVAGVAHELSNPLQVVAGYADLLKTGTADQPRIAAKADARRTAGRAAVEGEGADQAIVTVEDRGGPARAETVLARDVPVGGPQRIGLDVLHDHRLAPEGGGAARPGALADRLAVDGRRVGGGQAGRRAVVQAPALLVEEEDGADGAGRMRLDEPHERLERVRQRAPPAMRSSTARWLSTRPASACAAAARARRDARPRR